MTMLTLTCNHCSSDQFAGNRGALNRKLRYKCRAFGRQSRENPAPKQRRAKILKALHEHGSLRSIDIEHTFGISHNTVTTWMKKISNCYP